MPTDWKSLEARPEERTPVPARLLPGRHPLLWVLLPLIAAYLVADVGVRIPDTVLWIAGALATCVALASVFGGGAGAPPRARLWSVAFLSGVFFAGLLFHDFVRPPRPGRAGLPPREASLAVCVDELFATRFDTVSGVGTIVGAPPHLAELAGSRVQFRVTRHDRNPAFDLGATVRLRGVLDNAPAGDGFARYLRQRGIPVTLSRARLEAVEVPPHHLFAKPARARGNAWPARSRRAWTGRARRGSRR